MALRNLRNNINVLGNIIYSYTSLFAFCYIAFFWAISVYMLPAFIHANSFITIALIILVGFSLVTFIILNYQVFIKEYGIQKISLTLHAGSLISFALLMISLLSSDYLNIIPLALLCWLYYQIVQKRSGTTPTSQNHPPQEPV